MLQVSRHTAETIEKRSRRSPAAREGTYLEGSPQVPVYEEELWTARQRQAQPPLPPLRGRYWSVWLGLPQHHHMLSAA